MLPMPFLIVALTCRHRKNVEGPQLGSKSIGRSGSVLEEYALVPYGDWGTLKGPVNFSFSFLIQFVRFIVDIFVVTNEDGLRPEFESFFFPAPCSKYYWAP